MIGTGCWRTTVGCGIGDAGAWTGDSECAYIWPVG
jgi:hypothetical protein